MFNIFRKKQKNNSVVFEITEKDISTKINFSLIDKKEDLEQLLYFLMSLRNGDTYKDVVRLIKESDIDFYNYLMAFEKEFDIAEQKNEDKIIIKASEVIKYD